MVNEKTKIWLLVMVIVLISLPSCKRQNNDNYDLKIDTANVVSAELYGCGKSIIIDDTNEVKRIIQIINSIEFTETESDVIKLPGAVSLRIVINYDNATSIMITLPAWEVNGKVYDGGPDCIKRFSEYI